MMAASILLVRVTRGVFDDEMEGGLDRMVTMPLFPKIVSRLRSNFGSTPPRLRDINRLLQQSRSQVNNDQSWKNMNRK